MLRPPFRPSRLTWLAPAPEVQAIAILRFSDCRDYLDSICADTVAELRAGCDACALEWAATYDGPMRITRQGIAAVAAIMLRDCVAMAAHYSGPPRWLPYAAESGLLSGVAKCPAGFRTRQVPQPW